VRVNRAAASPNASRKIAMSRIQQTFAALAEQGRKGLIPFITAGDPDPAKTVEFMHALAEGGADGGGGLYDYFFIGIRQRAHDTRGVVEFGEGSGGAYGDALAAEGARGVGEFLFEGGGDYGHESAVDGAEGAYGLYFITNCFAPAAHDAFVHVAVECGGGVFAVGRHFGVCYGVDFPYSQCGGPVLQVATSGFCADEAVFGVVRQDQFHDCFSGVDYS